VGERGSLTVEAAFVVPLVLVVLLAVVEVTAAVATRFELVAAAREGARVAATTPDPAQAVEAVRGALPEPLARLVRVEVRRPQVVGRPAEVTVRYAKPLWTPFLEGMTVPLAARAVMRVER
jgi:hypothetical protein